MNIVVTGQKSFGKEVLKRLIDDGHNIVGIAPAPQGIKKDKMVGIALKYGIPILTEATKLTSKDIPDDTDLVVAAHSHWIVSEQIISKAKYGAIGFHPSLLPIHRGQDSVRWTVHMGDKVTGGTVFYLNDRADGGDVIKQELVFIDPKWNYHDLWNVIFPIGVDMISQVVNDIRQNGKLDATPQNEQLATWEPSFERPRLHRNELMQLE